MSLAPFFGRGSLTGAAPEADALATGTAGALARAYERGQLMPMPSVYGTQIGYTPAALYLADDVALGMRDSIGNALLAAVGTPVYRQWVKNVRGVAIDAGSEGFAANLYAPALASQVVIGAFSIPSDPAADRGLWGYRSDDLAQAYSYFDTSLNKVGVYVTSVAEAQFVRVTVDHELVFGDLYVLGYHINRTTNLVYVRLVNVTTGIAYTATSGSIATMTTITGATNPLFNVGYFPGAIDGTDVKVLGLAVHTAGIAGTDVLANMTTRLVGV